jgi:hypothetical protein
MSGLLIGLIWTVIIVGGVLALSALIEMIRSPYRKK